MDRFAEHLDVVSLPAAAALAAAVVAILLMTPSRLRLPASLAAMVIVLTVSRLTDIGPLASLAKVLSGFMFVLVGIAAYLQPGRRMPIPVACWAYVLAGAVAIWCVRRTDDSSLALVLRTQWLLLAVAALLTVRTVVDERSLRRVLLGLLCGCGLSSLITFSAVALAPIQALQNGFGRFMPYQSNPNQIGVLFALTVALGMYFALRTNHSLVRACCIGFTAIALGQSVLTLSRGSFLVIAITATPTVFVALRRPLFTIVGLGCVGVLFASLIHVAESSDFARVGGSVDERSSITFAVLDEVWERPLFGLAETEGLMAYNPDLNAHNAYVEMLYLGGITLAGPLIALQVWAMWNMTRVWLVRRRLPIDPLLISVLASLSVALFAHGFINDMIFYPTYTWAFTNVFIAGLSISLGACVARANTLLRHIPRARSDQRASRQPKVARRSARAREQSPLRPWRADCGSFNPEPTATVVGPRRWLGVKQLPLQPAHSLRSDQ